ncbi:MAG: hypothetical protein MKZ95_12850 [Pirellulales bacterium]|nr:hypothetical protein [Pirellulales bacterium]
MKRSSGLRDVHIRLDPGQVVTGYSEQMGIHWKLNKLPHLFRGVFTLFIRRSSF